MAMKQIDPKLSAYADKCVEGIDLVSLRANEPHKFNTIVKYVAQSYKANIAPEEVNAWFREGLYNGSK